MIVVAVLCVALGASLAANLTGNTAYAVDKATTTQQQRAALHNLEDAFSSIAEEALPSVVKINSERTVSVGQNPFNDDFFRNSPFQIPTPDGRPDTQVIPSSGSGVIVRSDGYILTNDHVAGGADKVTVTLQDGREFKGTVSRDPRGDLAIVKIDATGLPAATLGDSDKVKVGSWAIAIGSPFGYDQSVTVGVISAKGRHAAVDDGTEGRYYSNLIQTDASINPGNSGGPLINIDGEVIGINTLIRSGSGGNIGIGFAIPVNTAKFAMDQLIKTGKVSRGFLGVAPTDLTPKAAERYGIQKGALVLTVDMGTPADKAGVQVEDVIVEFDGKPVESENQFRELVAGTPPGKAIDLVIVRDKQRKTLKVTLEEAPTTVTGAPTEEVTGKIGFSVADLTPDLASRYNLDESKGVVITKVAPGGRAAQAGLKPGLIVRAVNGKPIKTVADFDAATKDAKAGDTLYLRLGTKERTMLFELPVE
jgi:Do/DeqQ family serine protease